MPDLEKGLFSNSKENRKGHGLFFDAERELFSIPVHPPAPVYSHPSVTEACLLVNRSDRASSKYHENSECQSEFSYIILENLQAKKSIRPFLLLIPELANRVLQFPLLGVGLRHLIGEGD